MPILAGLVLLIQFSFVIHAMKTGRPYWWIAIIMGFPVMGCLIYYFVEVFPGSREHRLAHRRARKLVRALQPDAELKRRAEELEVCGSTENKLALAQECVAHGMHPEAVKLIESCLAGPFAGDPRLLLLLARAAVEGGDWDKADEALAKLEAAGASAHALQARLLQARVLDGRGQTDGALAAYRALIPQFVGLEARYRYGELLSRLGYHDAAAEVFNEVIKHAKRFASSIEDEQHWAAAARQAIAS